MPRFVHGIIFRGVPSLRSFVNSDQGGAYTLSFVMVMPVLMLMVALVVETAIMLTAKLGTVHAAHAAARVACVHNGTTDWSTVQARSREAAKRSMIPFSSGSNRSQSTPAANDENYRDAYREWSDEPVADSYLRSKQRDASDNVVVTIVGPPGSWQSDITATVTYEYPFRLPGIGRLIGEPAADGGFVFPLTSQVTVPGDGPQNRTQSLGIGYGVSP